MFFSIGFSRKKHFSNFNDSQSLLNKNPTKKPLHVKKKHKTDTTKNYKFSYKFLIKTSTEKREKIQKLNFREF